MLAAILAAIIAVILIYGLSRYVFGRRLRPGGGRARQPRLGVIDAYDLDRQRQLVLVRRDNVEHLIMIGGPNDLLIESAFVRAQPAIVTPPARDKDAAVTVSPTASLPPPPPLAEPASEDRAATVQPAHAASPPQPTSDGPRIELPQTVLAQPPRAPAPRAPAVDLGRPVTPKDLGPLSDLPAPGPAAAPEPDIAGAVTPLAPAAAPPAAAAPAAAPLQAEPASPAAVPPRPSRFPTTVRPAGSPLPPRPGLAALRPALMPTPADPPGPPPPGNGAARAPALGLANRPTPLNALQRGTSASSLRRDLPGAAPPGAAPPGDSPPATAAAPPSVPAVVTAESADPEPSPPAPPVVRAPQGDPGITLDSIESLEEEMARLLGRAAGGEKS